MMEEGVGLQALVNGDRKHYFLLQITYNAGTGFLSDDSGMQLFYTRKEMEPAGKMIVGHRPSNKLIIMPEVDGWRTTGLCSSKCFDNPKSGMLKINSVSLHAGDKAGNARLVVMQEGEGETVVDGYRSDYQPVRQLYSPYGVNTGHGDVVVECTYDNQDSYMLKGGMGEEGREECFAVVTYTPKIEMVECVSEPDKSSMESSYRIEYGNYTADVETMLNSWTNLSEIEKREININSYNKSLAIFCTNDDLTKIVEHGIKAPATGEQVNIENCHLESEKSENTLVKAIRNSRVLSWNADIMELEESSKSQGSKTRIYLIEIIMAIFLFQIFL